MNPLNTIDPENYCRFVMIENNEPVTTSSIVAKRFNKPHRHVLRAIRNLECSDKFRLRNFGQTVTTRKNPSGGKDIQSPIYTMTKDGFVFLAMGFTGKEAAVWKERFIEAFNSMSDQVRSNQMDLWKQMQELIAKEVDSKVRASFGSHLMHKRKREIPYLMEEREKLEYIIQPSLMLN